MKINVNHGCAAKTLHNTLGVAKRLYNTVVQPRLYNWKWSTNPLVQTCCIV